MLTLNRPIILGIGTMFLTGMCVAHWRLERAFTKPLAPALALVVLACIFAYWTGVHTQHPPPLAGLPFAVLVMWAAFTPCLAWLRPFNRRVDLSYGHLPLWLARAKAAAAGAALALPFQPPSPWGWRAGLAVECSAGIWSKSERCIPSRVNRAGLCRKVKARALPWTRHAEGVLRTTGPVGPRPHFVCS
ncbi:MAG: hypothetical protein WDN04_12455 [Rhodospirillales bacterium]